MRRCWSGGILCRGGKAGDYGNVTIGVPFLVLDLGFDVIDGVGGFHLEGNGLAGKSLDEDLHATRQGMQVNGQDSWTWVRGRTWMGWKSGWSMVVREKMRSTVVGWTTKAPRRARELSAYAVHGHKTTTI